MVLVDFKGGATFAGMSDMPHVSAVITNLAQELTLVDRMQDALSGEMVRRQELLRDAGNFASIRDYERARVAGEKLDPMPSLFIVVDEFSEMLSAKPEFIDLFVAIGRLGRSLGLHLLLASQRLEEGRLRGLESHLSYRVGLRTFSAAESRSVLGVPDAYELPPIPGLGYLKPDQSTLLRFKARVRLGSAERQGAGTSRRGRPRAGHLAVHDLRGAEPRAARARARGAGAPAGPGGRAGVAARRRRRPDGRPRPGGPPGVAAAARRTRHPRRADGRPHRGPRARRRVARVARPRRAGRPARHRRPSARAASRHAHRQPQRRHRPRRRRRRPAQRQEHAAAHHRHQPVADHHAAGVAVLRPRLRRRHVRPAGRPARTCPVSAPAPSPTSYAGSWPRCRASSTGARPTSAPTASTRSRPTAPAGPPVAPTTGTATSSSSSTAGRPCAPTSTTSRWRSSSCPSRGLTFGLHIVSGAARWADFRAAMRDVFGTRLELRLGDAMDSEIDRKIAALVPTGRPGRGLTQSKLHFLAALPRIDGDADPDSLGEGVDDLIRRVKAAWRGPAGPEAAAAARRDRARRDPRAGRGRPARPDAAAGRDQREGARAGRPEPRHRAALPGLRRRPVRQELGAAHLRPRDHAHPHAEGGADRRRRLPPLAARRGARRVPAELPDVGGAGEAGAQGPRDVPREPHPRPGRHARAAAQPVVVERRRGVRRGRRLRPGRDPAELARSSRCCR